MVRDVVLVYIATTLCFLLHGQHTVSCIRCYECNTHDDPRCSDPFHVNTTTLTATDCVFDSRSVLENILSQITRLGNVPEVLLPTRAQGEAVIFPAVPTTCQKIHIQVLGESIVRRGCSGPAMDQVSPCDAVKLLATNDLQLDYCGVCETDACNTSPSTMAPRRRIAQLVISWTSLVLVASMMHF